MVPHVLVLLVSGAVVWWAGHQLSRYADELADATGIGRVFIGALLLGGVTSLPEVATTATAGVLGNPQLAIGNLMGGVALQVVVLAVADVIESRRGLMFEVSKPTVLVRALGDRRCRTTHRPRVGGRVGLGRSGAGRVADRGARRGGAGGGLDGRPGPVTRWRGRRR